MDLLVEVHTFLTLDASYKYWESESDTWDKERKTLTLTHGPYRFFRMPLGLKSSPTMFKYWMNIYLPNVKWQFAVLPKRSCNLLQVCKLAFGSPTSRFATTVKTWHINEIKQFFLLEGRIDYLGHLIQLERLAISTNLTHTISKLQQSTNGSEIKSFLCLCIVFDRFVLNFACIAALLNRK